MDAGRCWSVLVGVGRCLSVLVGAGRCWSVLVDACRCLSVLVGSGARTCRDWSMLVGAGRCSDEKLIALGMTVAELNGDDDGADYDYDEEYYDESLVAVVCRSRLSNYFINMLLN